MNNSELELAKLRSNFYCINYRRMIKVLLLMLVINFALTGIVFYYLASRHDSEYFATSQDGYITQIYPLSDPIMAPQEILQWASNIAVVAYTYNFINYNEVLEQLQKYFTASGWEKFKNTFKDPKVLNPIITKKIVVSSAINGTPILVESDVVNGYYVWTIQIPLLITYQSPVETTQQPIKIIMQVTRTSTRDVAIANLEVKYLPVPQPKTTQ